jgi:7-cyano-7-deazaguanine tRNA-ribosyltransferase
MSLPTALARLIRHASPAGTLHYHGVRRPDRRTYGAQYWPSDLSRCRRRDGKLQTLDGDAVFVREITTVRGTTHRLPMFLPVYQPTRPEVSLNGWPDGPLLDGCIVNAFFLYKQRELRTELTVRGLHDYLGFHALVATDSGAFQGFTRRLYLKNADIIRFQDKIGSDIISPLDLVTPPGDGRAIAEDKLRATEKRVQQGMALAERGTLVGVQQGGRFLDLRHRGVSFLRDLGVRYVALGSLVPFFSRNHDLRFVHRVARDARQVIGPGVPIHLYGAGDPCELPFLVASGVSVFDSSSYGHFARDGWYMTPYGALRDDGPLRAGEFSCQCPACACAPGRLPRGAELYQHNLWTIAAVMEEINRRLDSGTLSDYLEEIAAVHGAWFPRSALVSSWHAVQ